jgi:hypothetical protein
LEVTARCGETLSINIRRSDPIARTRRHAKLRWRRRSLSGVAGFVGGLKIVRRVGPTTADWDYVIHGAKPPVVVMGRPIYRATSGTPAFVDLALPAVALENLYLCVGLVFNPR